MQFLGVEEHVRGGSRLSAYIPLGFFEELLLLFAGAFTFRQGYYFWGDYARATMQDGDGMSTQATGISCACIGKDGFPGVWHGEGGEPPQHSGGKIPARSCERPPFLSVAPSDTLSPLLGWKTRFFKREDEEESGSLEKTTSEYQRTCGLVEDAARPRRDGEQRPCEHGTASDSEDCEQLQDGPGARARALCRKYSDAASTARCAPSCGLRAEPIGARCARPDQGRGKRIGRTQAIDTIHYSTSMAEAKVLQPCDVSFSTCRPNRCLVALGPPSLPFARTSEGLDRRE